MTAEKQKGFSEYLLRIGNGEEKTYNDVDGYYGDNIIKLPSKMCIKEFDIQNLIDEICPQLADNYTNPEYIQLRAILCT